MDSSQRLPEELLIAIISFLPLKDRVRTGVLSKRWKNLFYKTTNLSFKEFEFVCSFFTSWSVARDSFFFPFIDAWLFRNRPHDLGVDSFELCFSYPAEFLNQIERLIDFSVSKELKKLVIDFSNPDGRSFQVDRHRRYRNFELTLPESFYTLTTLESLELYGCKFNLSRFTNSVLLRSLSIGGIWFELEMLNDLLLRSPSLMSLNIKKCHVTSAKGMHISIGERLRELVVQGCDFILDRCTFQLPNIHRLEFTGKVFLFRFERMIEIIKEVHLDFWGVAANEQPNQLDGDVISRCVNELHAARTLAVSPYLLQVYLHYIFLQ